MRTIGMVKNTLYPCRSAFQRAVVIGSINGNRDEWIIVFVIKQASNDFIGTDIHETYLLAYLCI